MVILAIGAHPDDIEFGCYGTLSKWKKNNEIHFILFSAGELSAPKEERINEAKKSASLIGAKITVLDYPDGIIPVNAELISSLRNKIEDINPDIIFTLFPIDTHQDHRAVSKITTSSCNHVPKVFFYEVPQTRSFSPNYFVDVTETFKIKRKALLCFKTQSNKPYFSLEEIEGLAKYRAYKCFYRKRLFEAFVLYQEIYI